MSFSLEKLRDDPDFMALFHKKAVTIREDKKNLLSAASEYQDKYAREISEGTERRKMLLEDGARRGVSADDVFKDFTVFIPAKNTPLLNYLFFLLRENDYSPAESKVICEKYEKEFGHVVEEKDPTAESLPNMVSFVYCNIGDETFATIKKLKTLADSANEQEALQAYKKCREMCKKYNLEYAKIPTN